MLLNWLFNTNAFVSRNNCGPGWTNWLIASYIIASALIALSYFFIPVYLLVLWEQGKREISAHWILIFFVAFIGFCGLTHVNDVLVFFWPAYRWFTVGLWATALVSMGTAILLPRVVFSLITVYNENKRLHEALKRRKENLERYNETLSEIIKEEMWKNDTAGMLDKMQTMIRDVNDVWYTETVK